MAKKKHVGMEHEMMPMDDKKKMVHKKHPRIPPAIREAQAWQSQAEDMSAQNAKQPMRVTQRAGEKGNMTYNFISPAKPSASRGSAAMKGQGAFIDGKQAPDLHKGKKSKGGTPRFFDRNLQEEYDAGLMTDSGEEKMSKGAKKTPRPQPGTPGGPIVGIPKPPKPGPVIGIRPPRPQPGGPIVGIPKPVPGKPERPPIYGDDFPNRPRKMSKGGPRPNPWLPTPGNPMPPRPPKPPVRPKPKPGWNRPMGKGQGAYIDGDKAKVTKTTLPWKGPGKNPMDRGPGKRPPMPGDDSKPRPRPPVPPRMGKGMGEKMDKELVMFNTRKGMTKGASACPNCGSKMTKGMCKCGY